MENGNGEAVRADDPIRVVICDDHPQMRRGVREGLADAGDIEVVGEAGNGVEAVSVVGELRPDVALMDLKMPKLAGPEAIARIKDAGYLETKVLVLTTYDEDPMVRQALRAGAKGLIIKGADDLEIRKAVRVVARGGIYLHPEAQLELLKMAQGPTEDEPTKREHEVLRLIAQGKDNDEIAAALFISSHTVKDHVRSIFAKLRVNKRVQAVHEGHRRGYL